MAMDQLGWKEEDAILYLGITMACGGVLVREILTPCQFEIWLSLGLGIK